MIADGNNCVDPREASDEQVLNNGACYKNAHDADDVKIDMVRIAAKWDQSILSLCWAVTSTRKTRLVHAAPQPQAITTNRSMAPILNTTTMTAGGVAGAVKAQG